MYHILWNKISRNKREKYLLLISTLNTRDRFLPILGQVFLRYLPNKSTPTRMPAATMMPAVTV